MFGIYVKSSCLISRKIHQNSISLTTLITGPPEIRSPYRISVSRTLDLDIPEWAINAKKYSATLAHKACHSFTPNGSFELFEHPR